MCGATPILQSLQLSTRWAGRTTLIAPVLDPMLMWSSHHLQVLALARFDTAVAVAKGPQLLQALAAAWADVQVFRLTQLLFGHKAAR